MEIQGGRDEPRTITEGIMEEAAFKVTVEGWVSCRHDSRGRGLMGDMNFSALFHHQALSSHMTHWNLRLSV